MTPPPPRGNYNVLLFRNSLVLEALLQTVKSCINSIPPFCKKSSHQRSWKSWLLMGDCTFTQGTYAKIQIIKISCFCHDLALYLTLLKAKS